MNEKEYLAGQYRHLHRRQASHLNMLGSWTWEQRVVDLVFGFERRSILDYGCGAGTLVRGLREHFATMRVPCEVAGYDPFMPEFCARPSGKWSVVVTEDVLEHIPEGDLPDTLDELRGLTQYAQFHHIANWPARHRLPDGSDPHVTQRPYTWWRRLFGRMGYRLEGRCVRRRGKVIEFVAWPE